MSSARTSSYRPAKQSVSPRIELNGSAMSGHAQQQRLRPARQSSATTASSQGPPGSLRLPGLPRFHPANFPSAYSSLQATPTSGMNSPQPPVSPRSQQRQYNEAQRALLSYQRDFYAQQLALTQANTTHKRQGSNGCTKPASPRLMPMNDSPGPVTPLELEADGYLTAGSGAVSQAEQAAYVERVIREQVDRMHGGNVSPGGSKVPSNPVTPVGSY
ncbi:uncharacterized protein PV09_08152 [Verruconis gallopava]|uniref:Uncharacterized protein n=1 Tax=Verruconis gallopava TaxID=253628 RepID=A0A0D1YHE3_9PEZI|nr:uncharacterized protein PV09_08152 [Verruconis gallopava]KIW00262.1 hypothetical protein PV09_08152 [Verruconis gallopava]